MEKFANNVVRRFYETAVTSSITNSDYEGQVKGGGADRLNMMTLSAISLQNYTKGSNLTAQTIGDIEDQLLIDQQKAYYWVLDDVDKFEAYVNDYESSLIQDAGNKLGEAIDAFVLGKAEFNVGAGNQIGSDYVVVATASSCYVTTDAHGSVTITSVLESGGAEANTQIGSGFLSSMIGKGFKIDSGTSSLSTVWYRISNQRTSLQIDIINEDEAYDVSTGNLVDMAHGGGSASDTGWTVAAGLDAVTVSRDNIFDYIISAGEALDRSKASKTGRWLVVNSWLGGIIKKAPELTPAVPTAYENVVTKGLLGEINGFRVYQNENTSGTIVNSAGGGMFFPFGTKDWCTFAMAMTESGVEDIPAQFGKAYKGLSVYGAKVARTRRVCGGYIFAKKEA